MILRMIFLISFTGCLFAVDSAVPSAEKQCAIIFPDTGFGSPGKFQTIVDSCPSPLWPGHQAYLMRPQGLQRSPVIIFLHGIGASEPVHYDGLIKHLVSRGCAVMYAPYDVARAMSRPQEAYRAVRWGVDALIQRYSGDLDTARIGVVGHSYGAGMVPAIAYRMLVERHWGADGALCFIMAPWYSYEITTPQMQQLPRHVKVIVQIYEDDKVKDHRMALDLYNSFTVDQSEKAYYIVHSDAHDGCTLTSDHGVPSGPMNGEPVNALDFFGVYKPLDALVAYAFTKDSNAKHIALGFDEPEQRFMGRWPDSTPVREMTITRTAWVCHPQRAFLNFWDHRRNPRASYASRFGVARPLRYERKMTLKNYFFSIFASKEDSTSSFDDTDTTLLPRSPIVDGLGASGPYTLRHRWMPHPTYGDGAVHVFAPRNAPTPMPVVFFVHGFQWPTPDEYKGFIEHLVSRGTMVIFASYRLYYPSLTGRPRYDVILRGFDEAINMERPNIDTTRIGFIGHSFGGGAVPAIASWYLTQKQWGANGAYLYILAPWYAYAFNDTTLQSLPQNTHLVLQVFEDEKFNDWRIAGDIFQVIKIPAHYKHFLVVHNDKHDTNSLIASHIAPLADDSSHVDELDFYGIWRTADWLAEKAFLQREAPPHTKADYHETLPTYMGTWPDGAAIARMTVLNRPSYPHAQKTYLFKWSSLLNPRRKKFQPPE